MGEVPVLETGGRKLTQSAAILLFLAAKHGQYGGQHDGQNEGEYGDEHQEVLRWLFFDNHKFTSYFATWRFLKSFMPTPPDPTLEKFLRGRIDNAFGIVERHLAGRDYVVGAAPTIADISMCGYLFYPPEESGYDLAKQYPAIARWTRRLEQLPGWKHPYDLLPGERVAPRW
jgi:glutathione S-transferase